MAGTDGGSDFLYSVGIDLATATSELETWTKRTVPNLLTTAAPTIQLKVGYSAALTNVNNFVNRANASLSTIKPISISVNFRGASQSLNAFMRTFARQAEALAAFDARFASIAATADRVGTSMDGFGFKVQKAGGSMSNAVGAASQMEGGVTRLGGASRGAGTAVDWLGNVAKVSAFKMVEWAVVIQGLEKTIGMFKDSLTQASNVQMEQTLQSLYNMAGAQIDVNDALKNATTIARMWGGDIVDIQQAIGLWTKQTNDLAAATLLANKGEEMARASGIDTLTVYRDSIAIGAQMGITYGELPTVYDQVTRASLKLAEQLRSVKGEAVGSTEAMRDIFQGLKEASATLSANSFRDTASIIALVSNQIQTMGESGEQAAKNLSTMFGALSQGGKKRAEWEKILGVDAFKDAGTLLDAMQKHLAELRQAQADGLLGVRPAQVETLAAMEKSLEHIRELYRDIKDNSKGMLDATALAEMSTFQAQSDKLKTALQALEIEVGTRMLPTLERWTNWAATSAVPMLQSMIPQVISLAHAATLLGEAWLSLQVFNRIRAYVDASVAAFGRQQAALRATAEADALAQKAMFADAAAVTALKERLAALSAEETQNAEMTRLITNAYVKLGTESGITAEQLGLLTEKQREACAAADQERAAATAAATATGKLGAAAAEAAGEEDLLAKAGAAAADSVGGTAAMGKWDAAVIGIGSVAKAAMAAVSSLGPFLAMMMAINAWSDSQSETKNAALGIRTRAATAAAPHGGLSSNPAFWWLNPGQAFSSTQDAMTRLADLVQGKNGQLGSVAPTNLNTGPFTFAQASAMENSPEYGDQTKAIEKAWYSPGADFKKLGDEASALYTSYADNKTVTDSTSKEFAALQKMLAQEQASTRAALAKSMGAPEGPHDFANIPGKKAGGGGGNPYSQQLSDTTKAYQAAAEAAQKYAAADDTVIKTQETLMGMNGVTQQGIDAISKAYADKAKQYNAAAVDTEKYIAQLKSEIAHDQQVVASTTANSKAHKQASEAEKNATDDLVKAQATLVDMEQKRNLAQAQGQQVVAKYTAQLLMAKLHVDDYSKAIANINKTIGNTQGYAQQLNAIILSEAAVNKLSIGLNECLSYVEQHMPKNTALIKLFKAAIQEVEQEGARLAKEADTDTDKLHALGEEARKLGSSLEVGNFKSLADILGVNKQTVDYIDQMLQGMDAIAADQQKLNDLKKQLNEQMVSSELPEVQAIVQQELLQVQYAQSELNLKKQLLPIEQQILSIRSSTAYQAWNSQIESTGKSLLSNLTKNLFNFGNSSTGNGLHQFFAGIMNQMMDAWWKGISSKITDALFGASGPEAKLQATFNTLYQNLQAQFNAFGGTVNGPLTTAVGTQKSAATIMNQAADKQIQAAQMMAGQTGSSNGFVFGDQLPGGGPAWDSSGMSYDDTYNVSPSTVSNSYADISQTAIKATDIADNVAVLPEATQYLSQIADSFTSLQSGGGAPGGIGGGFLGSLLGLLGLGGTIGKPGANFSAGIFGSGSFFQLLPMMLGIGSGLGAVEGAGTGQAGEAQHQQYGMFGGLLGGIGGSFAGGLIGHLLGLTGGAAAGPLGMIVGTLLGSLLGGAIGGLFGDHFPIQNEPDIGEPVVGGVSYGQFVANWTGAPGSFNGQTINPQSQWDGHPEVESILAQISSVLSNPNSSQSQINAAKALQALEGGTGPNKGLGIASEKDDMFTLNDGKTVNVEQFMGYVQTLMKNANSSTGSTQLAPLMSVNVYGGGKNFKLNPYNTPGMTNQDFQQFLNAKWMGWPGVTSPYGAYSTPGVGGSPPPPGSPGYPPPKGPYGPGGPGGAGQQQNLTIRLVVDGKTLAQIVNAYNAEALLNAGRGIEHVPPIY